VFYVYAVIVAELPEINYWWWRWRWRWWWWWWWWWRWW